MTHDERSPLDDDPIDGTDPNDRAHVAHESSNGNVNPPPPPPVRKWVTYMVAFGVSVAVGLAPLLGALKVPLFAPLLDQIPDTLRKSLIPLTSALMGLVAVLVQWYSEEDLERSARRKALILSLLIAFTGAIAFYVVTIFVVKSVDFGGEKTRATGVFLIGFSRPYREPCGPGIGDEECITRLSFDQDKITSFWGSSNVNLAKVALSATYVSFMVGFASAVGVVMHRKDLKCKEP